MQISSYLVHAFCDALNQFDIFRTFSLRYYDSYWMAFLNLSIGDEPMKEFQQVWKFSTYKLCSSWSETKGAESKKET